MFALSMPLASGLLLLSLALSAFVYYPITRAYFFEDDFLNLYLIINRDFPSYVTRPHGGHLLAVRNTVFYVFYQAFGTRADLYFWVVLITHLVNVYLLFQTVRRLTQSPFLASFGAALWGTSPVQAGALAWYSVYGHVLVTTIVLFILSRVARIVGDGKSLTHSTVIAWPLLLFAASTCFGVGIGITLASPVALFLLLPASRHRTWLCLILCALAVAFPFIYRGLLGLHEWVSGPSSEVIEITILYAALGFNTLIVTMLGSLLSYGMASLVLGFHHALGKFPDALFLTLTGLYVAVLTAAFLRSTSVIRRQMLGLSLFAIGCYGMIACGRAMFFGPATIAHASALPRYHYAGSVLLAILLCVALARVAGPFRIGVMTKSVALAAWVGVTLLGYAHSRPFLDLHPSSRRETASTLAAMRARIVKAPPGSDVYIPNQRFNSIGHLLAGDTAAFPGWAGMFTIFFPSNVVGGRRVYFVDDDPVAIIGARKGRRTADLLVTSDRISNGESPGAGLPRGPAHHHDPVDGAD